MNIGYRLPRTFREREEFCSEPKAKEYRIPIQLNEENGSKLRAVCGRGKLAKEDYEHFVPETKRFVQQPGTLRLLFDMMDFHRWETVVLWEDEKFAINYFADIARIAMVGQKKWQYGIATCVSRLHTLRYTTLITLLVLTCGSGWPMRSRLGWNLQ